jgi:hypothetical protein
MANTGKIEAAFTVDMIIDLIRSTRNQLAKDLLAGEALNNYYHLKSGKELSVVKKEFIKRDLQSLMIIPLDLGHYGGLILKIKEENARTIPEEHMHFFWKEIDGIVGKYVI